MTTSTTTSKSAKALKAAWTNWKAGRYTSWSECLKSAWAWVKKQAATFTVYASDSYKTTEKAIRINGIWWPKSQITENWKDSASGKFSYLESITVPAWLYNSKMNSY